jgi:hypothetical protein
LACFHGSRIVVSWSEFNSNVPRSALGASA